MNRLITIGSLTAALAVCALAAPTAASASCSDRKATGTVIGGVGGALIGNSIAGGGGGAVLGGLGGAVLGHQIAANGCRGYRSAGYYPYHRRYASRRHYYRDERYRPIDAEAAGPYAQASADRGYGGAPACRTETQSYYDNRGALARRDVQVCGR